MLAPHRPVLPWRFLAGTLVARAAILSVGVTQRPFLRIP